MYNQTLINFTCTKKRSDCIDYDSRINIHVKQNENLDTLLDHFKQFCAAIGYFDSSIQKIVMLEDNEEVVEKDEEEELFEDEL